MSYTIELYRRNIKPSNDIVEFATYISFFPTIMSGPIDRPNLFIPQLKETRVFDPHIQIRGLEQILWGLFKKMVIADNLATIINESWTTSDLPASSYFIAMLFYSVQIYADFSGYSDMAIGVAKLLGINVTRNFNYPYFARNISDFWRRWHISLTTWFTDYLYIPLGGNRAGKYRTMLNSVIVFTVCGLWHGADWSFVLWGCLNGLLFVPYLMQKKPRKFKEGNIPATFDSYSRILLMFLVASVCWVFFRAENVNNAIVFFGNILQSSILSIPRFSGMTNITFMLMLIYLIVFFVIEWKNRTKECPLFIENKTKFYRLFCYSLILISIYFLGADSSSFIYFNF